MNFQTRLLQEAFVPPAPSALGDGMPLWEVVRRTLDNPLSAIPDAAFRSPSASLSLIGRKLHYVCDPAMVREVLEDCDGFYGKSKFQTRLQSPLLGRGIVPGNGTAQEHQRHHLLPLFELEALTRHCPMLAERIEDETRSWGRLEVTFDFERVMRRLVLSLLLELMGGADLVNEQNTIAADFHAYLEAFALSDLGGMANLPAWLPKRGSRGPRRAARRLRRTLERVGDALARKAEPSDDLIGRMPGGMSRTEITGTLANVLFAAYEPTASAVTWTAYLLAMFPQTAERLRDEMRWMNVRDLRLGMRGRGLLAGQIFAESLRLYPPTPLIARDSLIDHSLADVDIDKGDLVLVSPWIIHRHRKLWRSPELFRPDRFAPGSPEPVHPYAWIPFGAGAQSCFGGKLAELLTRLVLRAVLRRFRLATVTSHAIVPQARLSLRPKGGLPLTLIPRD